MSNFLTKKSLFYTLYIALGMIGGMITLHPLSFFEGWEDRLDSVVIVDNKSPRALPNSWRLIDTASVRWHPVEKVWRYKKDWPEPQGWVFLGAELVTFPWQWESLVKIKGHYYLGCAQEGVLSLKYFECGSDWDEEWVMEGLYLPTALECLQGQSPRLTLCQKHSSKKITFCMKEGAYTGESIALWQNPLGQIERLPLNANIRDSQGTEWDLLAFDGHCAQLKGSDGFTTECFAQEQSF